MGFGVEQQTLESTDEWQRQRGRRHVQRWRSKRCEVDQCSSDSIEGMPLLRQGRPHQIPVPSQGQGMQDLGHERTHGGDMQGKAPQTADARATRSSCSISGNQGAGGTDLLLGLCGSDLRMVDAHRDIQKMYHMRQTEDEAEGRSRQGVPKGKLKIGCGTLERVQILPDTEQLLAWPCAQTDAAAEETRKRLQKLSADLAEAGFSTTDVDAQLAKLPKPCANQPPKDRATLTNMELKVNENYSKLKKQFATHMEEVLEEEQQRDDRLAIELKKADEDHAARTKAVKEQHNLHMANTLE